VKILISCLYLPLFRLSTATKRRIGALQSESLVILFYHGVSRSQRPKFARQMDFLKRHTCIVPADWAGGTMEGRACAITFDDGFVSTLANALPELQERQIPCTLFVPAGVMGRAPDWEMEASVVRDEIVADGHTISKLASPLVTVGSHSMSHRRLSQITVDLARSEIEHSRSVLSDLLGREVRLISFPYGDYDRSVVDLCVQAGYEIMYSIEPVAVDPRGATRVRGRVEVTPDDSLLEIYLKSTGGYGWMPVASAIKRWVMRVRPKVEIRRAA
jgi:peptidoglycan/xylan/chitin deacetylase (PgdA/CDA1 family)